MSTLTGVIKASTKIGIDAKAPLNDLWIDDGLVSFTSLTYSGYSKSSLKFSEILPKSISFRRVVKDWATAEDNTVISLQPLSLSFRDLIVRLPVLLVSGVSTGLTARSFKFSAIMQTVQNIPNSSTKIANLSPISVSFKRVVVTASPVHSSIKQTSLSITRINYGTQ